MRHEFKLWQEMKTVEVDAKFKKRKIIFIFFRPVISLLWYPAICFAISLLRAPCSAPLSMNGIFMKVWFCFGQTTNLLSVNAIANINWINTQIIPSLESDHLLRLLSFRQMWCTLCEPHCSKLLYDLYRCFVNIILPRVVLWNYLMIRPIPHESA